MVKFRLLVAMSAVFGLAAISSASGISFIGGRAMLPLQALKDYFGAKITYDSRHGIGISLDYHTATLRPGYRHARVDRRDIALDGDVVVIGGVTYVPASFVSDAFGYNCNRDDQHQRMTFLRPQTKKRVVIRYDQHREPNTDRGREQYRGKPSEKSHPGNGHADGH